MARARKHRRLPTLIDRGIGLLEVILPQGAHDDTVTALPPGQRDPGGFWFPTGYAQPGDIFTPAQRKLQAKQRLVQRHRLTGRPIPPPIVSGSEGTAAADTTPSRPHAPPVSRPAAPAPVARTAGAVDPGPVAAGLADRPLPLPAPASEVPETRLTSPKILASRRTPPATPAVRPTLPEPDRARAMAEPPVVDSRRGSE